MGGQFEEVWESILTKNMLGRCPVRPKMRVMKVRKVDLRPLPEHNFGQNRPPDHAQLTPHVQFFF